MNFRKAVIEHIEKFVGVIKDEEDIKEVLKRKLTKKELKVFIAIETNIPKEEIAKSINANTQRVEELFATVCKKLNQEKIKKELVKE